MFEGSSVDEKITKKIFTYAKKFILIILDSNHTSHVSRELEIYSKLIKLSYIILPDTYIGYCNNTFQIDLGPKSNPMTL